MDSKQINPRSTLELNKIFFSHGLFLFSKIKKISKWFYFKFELFLISLNKTLLFGEINIVLEWPWPTSCLKTELYKDYDTGLSEFEVEIIAVNYTWGFLLLFISAYPCSYLVQITFYHQKGTAICWVFFYYKAWRMNIWCWQRREGVKCFGGGVDGGYVDWVGRLGGGVSW